MKEIFKDIKEPFDLEGLYQISNKGNIRKLRKDGTYVTKKQFLGHCGYMWCRMMVKGKVFKNKTHRLVALQFIPNTYNRKTVNHKDGNKLNNSVNNLEWLTIAQNLRHAKQNNLIAIGIRIGCAKLNDNSVREIRKLRGVLSHKKIADIYNVSEDAIRSVLSNKTWIHVN